MAHVETLVEVLRDSARPAFLFGSTPPREGTSIEKAKESCAKFVARSAVLATDGFIIYDIQDEAGRTDLERPFPFRRTMNPALYGSFFPALTGKQCVIYKCAANDERDGYVKWIDDAVDTYGHRAFNLVGAASSSVQYNGIHFSDAAALLNQKKGCSFGCVCIPERHTKKQNENTNMLRKMKVGAEWFITQGIFNAGPLIKLVNDYGDLCRREGLTPKKVVLTFAPCGRPKTMQFIKWLGMDVPEAAEQRILNAANPVRESLTLLQELLVVVLEQTGGSGVPLGINVESLSIFKEEIDAAHELFQTLQATLLNSRGSPWAVQWFCVRRMYTAAQASSNSLLLLENEKKPSESTSDTPVRPGLNAVSETAQVSQPETMQQPISSISRSSSNWSTVSYVLLAGVVGVIIGRQSIAR